MKLVHTRTPKTPDRMNNKYLNPLAYLKIHELCGKFLSLPIEFWSHITRERLVKQLSPSGRLAPAGLSGSDSECGTRDNNGSSMQREA